MTFKEINLLCVFIHRQLKQRLTDEKAGCDHTFGLTREWCKAHSMLIDEVIPFLQARGGDCDCMVIKKVGLQDVRLTAAGRRFLERYWNEDSN